MKIVRIPIILAVMASILTTALSSPFEEAQPPIDRSISGANSMPSIEPLPPDGEGGGPHPGHGAYGGDRPQKGPYRAEGVALERGETYFLHIWLIDTIRIPPALARDMLRENRSLDEIREEISASEGTNSTRGGMILGENRFILAEINQTIEENCTVLDAELVEFEDVRRGAFDRTAGHITIRTCEEDGVQVGVGNLTLSDDQNTTYRLTFLPGQLEHLKNGPTGGGP